MRSSRKTGAESLRLRAKRQVEGRENPYFPLSAGAFVGGTTSNMPVFAAGCWRPFSFSGQEIRTLATKPRPALPLLKKKNGYVLDEGK